jgi:hypothetical protein
MTFEQVEKIINDEKLFQLLIITSSAREAHHNPILTMKAIHAVVALDNVMERIIKLKGKP